MAEFRADVSELVEGPSFFHTDLSEMRRRKARYLFELRRQVVYAAEPCLVGNFRKGQLVVHQQLFYFFDTLQNKILLNGLSFHGRKKVTEITVLIGDVFR